MRRKGPIKPADIVGAQLRTVRIAPTGMNRLGNERSAERSAPIETAEVDDALEILARRSHKVLVSHLHPRIGRDDSARLLIRVHEDLPLDTRQHGERASRLIPLGGVRLWQGTERPPRGPERAPPPLDLKQRIRHCATVADDVDES